jgi:hypothetical protein
VILQGKGLEQLHGLRCLLILVYIICFRPIEDLGGYRIRVKYKMRNRVA